MQKKGILFSAYTYSPLHAGVGQTIGLVDLPLEREKHTGYPCVYATGVKGALKSYMQQENLEEDIIDAVFGSEDGAGGWIFTDLKILFFPVRASEDSPVPIHFLTIKPGSRFVFLFTSRKKQAHRQMDTINRLKNLICAAGKNYGFGAKTASGYGYFSDIPGKGNV
jgi:CRISPR/Cas system CMR subunit Cmr4 (Cas7 group RAMP superfamily)